MNKEERKRAEVAIRGFLNTLVPEEFRDEHLEMTPERFVRAFDDFYLRGYRQDPKEILKTRFRSDYDELILLKDIPFYSMCAHHLAPFSGIAHVAYIPDRPDKDGYEITGLSKLARLVECYARRLQVQERMTIQIATALEKYLKPKGVGVILKAEHLCVACRGIEKPHTETITSVMRGVFMVRSEARQELLHLIKGV